MNDMDLLLVTVIVCAVLLIVLIPRDIWRALLYALAILVVGNVCHVALLLLLTT